MVRTQISLTREQFEALKTRAEVTGTSMAAVIREAVDRTLAASTDDLWDRALGAVGTGRSGMGDVSVDHDRHVADAFA
ncbi:MAG: ribbon-helix-helix protein, CopG family [Acidimicrobiales bacterium]